MKILVSNIGSTSFKFRLFGIGDRQERQLAAGGADRIGQTGGTVRLRIAGGDERSQPHEFADHGQAIRYVLDRLVTGGALKSTADLDAVAFKAVMGGDCEPVAMVDEKLMERMEYFAPVAPAHNPPYVAAMRMFRKVLPDVPLVAAFDSGFHRTMPDRRRFYAIAPEWASDCGVKRYGFHGASHRYIATRLGQLAPQARRIISCHLGGSSSICAIRDGKSVATSMGLSPQSGLPQGTRVGEFDAFGLKLMMSRTHRSLDDLLGELGSRSGLGALSGTGGDMRDIRQAARAGSKQAGLAIDIFVTAVRDYVGAYLIELGGTDALVFTGGIGQNNPDLREAVCEGMEFVGISLDPDKNKDAAAECRMDAPGSSAEIWVMPTNEELIVARQAAQLLRNTG